MRAVSMESYYNWKPNPSVLSQGDCGDIQQIVETFNSNTAWGKNQPEQLPPGALQPGLRVPAGAGDNSLLNLG